MTATQIFDYIVVGAGTAGSVVAARLAAHGSVLLLEAGGSDRDPAMRNVIADPSLVLAAIWSDALSKRYWTEPQPGVGGRPLAIQQGRVRGGSSTVNGMIYVRGNARDYDLWAQLGNDGWSHEDVLPFFRRSENFGGGASQYHGAGGPLDVGRNTAPSRAALAFVDAVSQVFPESRPDWDFNGAQQENAAGLYQVTVTPEGVRASAAAAFLDPLDGHSTPTVKLGARALRILIEHGRAVGIECRVGDEVERYRAEGEIVLAAGAFESPKLLMLSGIGSADHLLAHGIAPIVDLPGVGQNLMDHLQVLIYHPATSDPGKASFTAEAGLFINSRHPSRAVSPDLQFHVLGGLPGPMTNFGPTPSFLICPVLCKPQSRGSVSLCCGDPRHDPIIDPRYLECDADMQVLLRGIQWAEHFARLGALGALLDRNAKPYAVPNPFQPAMVPLPDTAAERAQFVRQAVTTVWHPSGTCKMGLDQLAVVDPRLHVRGIDGLRIADASVMPVIPSGNTNAVCYMIGEMCAEWVITGAGPLAGPPVASRSRPVPLAGTCLRAEPGPLLATPS